MTQDHPGKVTTRDGQEVFHRLIREYKAEVPRAPGQTSADYQADAEAAARDGLRAALEALSRERILAALANEATETD